jgi:hypothetical protein
MDQLVDYARSGKGQDGQGSASQAQTRSTGVSGASGLYGTLGGVSVVQVQELARTLWIVVIDNSERLSEPRRRAVMRENNRWILAGASAGVMLMVLEAVPAELTSDNHWAQAYGRQDKDCLEWSDTCVICVRAQSGGDYSCSNIGIACQPKEVRCMRRADEKTK